MDIFDLVYTGDVDTVREYIDKGGDPCLSMSDGTSLLSMACDRGSPDIVKVLLDTDRIPIDIGRSSGVYPLNECCRNVGIAKMLLDYGMDPNTIGLDGYTVLTYAVDEDIDMVLLLLSYKDIDVDKKDSNDITPLYRACAYGNIDIVEALLDHGASIDIATENGLSVMDINDREIRNAIEEVILSIRREAEVIHI